MPEEVDYGILNYPEAVKMVERLSTAVAALAPGFVMLVRPANAKQAGSIGALHLTI